MRQVKPAAVTEEPETPVASPPGSISLSKGQSGAPHGGKSSTRSARDPGTFCLTTPPSARASFSHFSGRGASRVRCRGLQWVCTHHFGPTPRSHKHTWLQGKLGNTV